MAAFLLPKERLRMKEKRYKAFGKSFTEEGLDNFACFLVDNRDALEKGEKVEEPIDFNQPNKANQERIVKKWTSKSELNETV